MEAEALYDFENTDEEELRFSKGAVLKILNTDDNNWYFAEIKGREGYIPSNYIKYEKPSWFVDKFEGVSVFEQLLKFPTGTFICRPSRSFPGEFALSVVNSELKLTHFRVFRNTGGFYNIWKEKFTSLNQLVAHYKRHALINCDIPLILTRPLDCNSPSTSSPTWVPGNISRSQTNEENEEDDDEVFVK